jgi:glycosyltransferase involved in cell wall biosynthesis
LATVSVVLPSLLKKSTDPRQSGRLFLEQAVGSIRAQTAANRVTFQIVVGLDAGGRSQVPAGLAERLGIQFAESNSRSIAAALNAAVRCCNGDYIAFLEDDDQWHPLFIETALAAFQQGADFVSSTQLEVTEQNEVIRIVDFATASSWLMPRKTWETVGEFDESYRIHHDNEWLGRLGDKGCRRIHLVEATAPVIPEIVTPVRPWLSAVLKLGGPSVRLLRHGLPWPLVLRLVHQTSVMQKVEDSSSYYERSQHEHQRLQQTFGRVPW